jgi:hypothetical protein
MPKTPRASTIPPLATLPWATFRGVIVIPSLPTLQVAENRRQRKMASRSLRWNGSGICYTLSGSAGELVWPCPLVCGGETERAALRSAL